MPFRSKWELHGNINDLQSLQIISRGIYFVSPTGIISYHIHPPQSQMDLTIETDT